MTGERRIVALGGGGFSVDGFSPIDRFVLDRTGSERPRVCFLATAAGDADSYIVSFHEEYGPHADASHVRLFGAPDPADVRARLLEADAIYVGGGNTANMLAVWRLHGVDALLLEAWEAGTVLAGVSAGANCWFEASTTDSFGPIGPLYDGLGLLPGSFCPHYDAEPDRRPRYLELVADGFPAGYAAENQVALRFDGAGLVEALTWRDGGRAFRVERGETEAAETPLATRRLG